MLTYSTATPPPPLPTLSINDLGRVYLHQTLVDSLDLQDGQPINLILPPPDSAYWHLDLRPEAERRVVHYQHMRARISGSGLDLPPALVDELLEASEPLTLYLLPGEPAIAGYYPLLPAAAFAQAYTAFLAQAAQAARVPAPRLPAEYKDAA